MKKIFLIFLILLSFLFSSVSDCKTDIYFANGILTKDKDAENTALKILRPAISLVPTVLSGNA